MKKNFKNNFYQFTRSNSYPRLFLMIIFSTAVLIACQSKSQTENNEPESKATAVDVCELISKQDVEQTYNIIVENVKNTLQNSAANGQSFVSQCSYTVKSGKFKSVSILFKYSALATSPKTFDDFLELNTPAGGTDNPEQKEIVDEVRNSYINGTKVTEMGDFGVWYNWAEIPSLMLYFNEHYYVLVNLIGFEYNDETFGMTKNIVSQIMANFD